LPDLVRTSSMERLPTGTAMTDRPRAFDNTPTRRSH
jgi:predicted TIM-barrel enzyme